jgi:hypothetical protein
MKAMRLADSGATAVLVEENAPQPQPGRGAYTGEVKQRCGRGKLVIAVVADDGSSSDE